MADVSAKHAFVSAKSDSPDTTLVSASEWNADHIFTGGINGQHMVYDDTQPNNVRWTDGEYRYTNTYAVVASTPVPVVGLAPVTLICASPIIATFFFSVGGFTSVGNANGDLSLYIDGTNVAQFAIPSPLVEVIPAIHTATLTAGTYAITLRIGTVGNVNVLTAAGRLSITTHGV